MKPYKMTKKLADQIKKDFIKKLDQFDLTTSNFSYRYSIDLPKKKKTLKVHCLPTAFHKMQNLVKNTSSEIAWHMTVVKTSKTSLCIKDVFVYPQTVTSATVSTDDIKYPTWLSELDDEIFNELRGQGHSHVNMSVKPSGVDTSYYSDLLRTMKSGFYLFLIMNKKGDMFIEVVDVDNNIVYEENDIDFEVATTNYNETSWYAEQMANIEVHKYTTTKKSDSKEEKERKNYASSIWDDFDESSTGLYKGGSIYHGFD